MPRPTIEVTHPSHDALQAALDQAGAAGGAIVRIPAGRYRIERPLLIDRDTHLIGAGRDHTVLVLAPGAGAHLLQNRASGAERIAIDSLTLDGDADHQERPDGSTALVWACGGCFRGARRIRIVDVDAVRIRQTAFHFYECTDVVLERVVTEDVGWSGVSTSGTDDITLRSVVVRRAGLDTVHSGIHLDGGTGAYVDAIVEDATGNAIMIDSEYGPMTNVVVRGRGRRSDRGVSLNGSPKHPLRNAFISGDYSDNERAGILVSNAAQVFIVDATLARNGEHGILLQGRHGAKQCVIADCTFEANPMDLGQIDASADNHFPASSADGDRLRPGRVNPTTARPTPVSPTTHGPAALRSWLRHAARRARGWTDGRRRRPSPSR